MPYERVTAFGTTRGNLTDEDRLIASENSQSRSIAAQQAALREQIAASAANQGRAIGSHEKMQGLELADRGVGREHQLDVQDRGHGNALELDDRATDRAFAVTDRAAAPQKVLADLEVAKHAEGAGLRGMRTKLQERVLGEAMNGMPGGAPGAPTASGAAGAPAGGGGGDREMMMYLAFGGNPGELANIRRQEANTKTARSDALNDRNYQTALKLLESPNPQARALGSEMLAKTGPPGAFTGQDPKVLENALVPEQAPAGALEASPALSLALDEVAQKLTKGASSFGAEEVVSATKPMIDALVQKMTVKGVREEEARAHIKQELAKRLPQTGFWKAPLSSLIDTFVPGTPMADMSSESVIRRGVGVMD